jgi:hypothetical protein
MQPRVLFGPSSWVLTIGAALAGIAAAVQAYTDAGGPGADYLAGLAAVLAAVLAILRTVQATFLAKYGETVVISEQAAGDRVRAAVCQEMRAVTVGGVSVARVISRCVGHGAHPMYSEVELNVRLSSHASRSAGR